MKNLKRFTFRVPSELFDAIETIAKANHRSVTAEIIVAIEDYLKEFNLAESSVNGNDDNITDR